ncbi:MAG: SMP-30/gluconolactonase/LRE family protein [Acidimicrobiales bacterium]|nr:SMP-30/gluconolactonase/LRE family protein [Acidimicrobiales bacterium]
MPRAGGSAGRARGRVRARRTAWCAAAVVVLATSLAVVATGPSASAGPLPAFNLTWGSQGATNGLFSSPKGVAFSPVTDQVYVADSVNNRIQVFTRDGAFVRKWGRLGTTNGRFNDPRGVAVDSAGNVYVVDRLNHRVQKFTSTGTFVTAWGSLGSGDGQFRNPRGIALDPNGTVYVADTGNDRVQRFSNTGAFLGKWGSTGSANGQFSIPSDVAVGSNVVYVADSGNDRVQRFNSSGVFAASYGGTGSGPGQFEAPRGIVYDPVSFEFVVIDTGNDRLQRFDLNGVYLQEQGETGTGDGQFKSAEDVGIDVRGNLFVADTSNHRVQRFGFAGPAPPFVRAFGTSGSGPGQFDTLGQLATDAEGNVYAADTGNDRVTKHAPDGPTLLTIPGTVGVTGVAVGDDGTIYVVTPGTVTAFSATGAQLRQWAAAGATAIAISPVSGDLFVVDDGDDEIEAFDDQGSFLRRFGSVGAPCTGNLTAPGGVAVDTDGRVYVSDRSGDCVQVFTEAGAFVEAWGEPGAGPGTFTSGRQVTVGPDGSISVVDDLIDLVQTFTPEGDVLASWGTQGLGLTFGNLENPTGVAADPFGNVFVADRDNHRIQRFAASGAIDGTVTGPGGPLAGAFVAAVQWGSFGLARAGFTDATGGYDLAVPPGRYTLVFIDPLQGAALEWHEDHAFITQVAPEDLVVVNAGATVTVDAALAASGVPAATNPATLSGMVTGPGGAMAGVFVVATDFDTGRMRGATTNASGSYVISGLHPGTGYRVEFVDPTAATLVEWHDNQPAVAIEAAAVLSLPAGGAQVVNAVLADDPGR